MKNNTFNISMTMDYIEPYGMGHLSKTELNLTHFYTKPNFLLDPWKGLAELNKKQLEVKNNNLGEVIWERNI